MLATWSADRLRVLLRARPDLARPAPARWEELATRALSRASVEAALDQLDRAQLLVLEALASHSPADLAQLSALLSRPDDDLAPLLDHLAASALTLPAAPAARPPGEPAVPAVPDAVAAALDTGPPGPGHTNPAEPSTTPDRQASTLPAALVRNASMAAVTDLLRDVRATLDAVDHLYGTPSPTGTPSAGLPTLRSGAVGQRSLRALARHLGVEQFQLTWTLELAGVSGLLQRDPGTGLGQTTPAAAAWRAAERAEQWRWLVHGWLHGRRAPLAHPAEDAASPRPWAPEALLRQAPLLRQALLQAALHAERQSAGVLLQTALPGALAQVRPRLMARTLALAPSLLKETDLLGLTGAGALSELGRAVAEHGLPEATGLLRDQLPSLVDHVRLQGDLTAVAPGPLVPHLTALLSEIAEPEGIGVAAQFRFTEASMRRALAAGWTADSLLDSLRVHSRDDIPGPLVHLVRDAQRVQRRGSAQAGGPTTTPRQRSTAGRGAARTAATVPSPSPELDPFPSPDEAHRAEVEADVAAAVAGLLRAPVPGSEPLDSAADAVAVVRRAVWTGQALDLEMVTSHGLSRRLTVQPLRVKAGRLLCRPLPAVQAGTEATDDAGTELTIPLHRVTRAVVAEREIMEDRPSPVHTAPPEGGPCPRDP